jgi:hypothetical protein
VWAVGQIRPSDGYFTRDEYDQLAAEALADLAEPSRRRIDQAPEPHRTRGIRELVRDRIAQATT